MESSVSPIESDSAVVSDANGGGDENHVKSKKAIVHVNGVTDHHGDDTNVDIEENGSTPQTQPYDIDSIDTNGISTLDTETYDLNDDSNESAVPGPLETVASNGISEANKTEKLCNNTTLIKDSCVVLPNGTDSTEAIPSTSSSDINSSAAACSSYSGMSVIPDEHNGVIDLTDDFSTRPTPIKVPSIQLDAEEIAALLHIENVNAVYQKVYKNRLLGNRVEVVTNNILEYGINDVHVDAKPQSSRNAAYPSEISNDQAMAVNSAQDDAQEKFIKLYSDLDEVKHVIERRHPGLAIDPNFIYAELEANYDDPSRIVVVANLITKEHLRDRERKERRNASLRLPVKRKAETISKPLKQISDIEEAELADEVDVILKEFPGADQNDVFSLLREHVDSENRTDIVVKMLLSKQKNTTDTADQRKRLKTAPTCTVSKPPDDLLSAGDDDDGNDDGGAGGSSTSPGVSSEEEQLLNNDPIYRDMCTIALLFPDRDKNEIYAYLEAHHDRPNRIDIVTDELLRLQEQSQEDKRTGNTASTSSTASSAVATDTAECSQQSTDLADSSADAVTGTVTDTMCRTSECRNNTVKIVHAATGVTGENAGGEPAVPVRNSPPSACDSTVPARDPATSARDSVVSARDPAASARDSEAPETRSDTEDTIPSNTAALSIYKPSGSGAAVITSEQNADGASAQFAVASSSRDGVVEGGGQPDVPLSEQLQLPINDEELLPLVQLQQDVDTVRAIFADCDPMWLYETLASRHAHEDRVQNLISDMSDNRTYPRLKERLDKERRQKAKERIMNMQLDINEFLEMFPDPEAHFMNTETPVSVSYREHCRTFLRNKFDRCSYGFIDTCMDNHNGHLLPAVAELERACEVHQQSRGRRNRGRSRFRVMPRAAEAMPAEPDERFYRELLYVEHGQKVKDHIKERQEARERRLAKAKEDNELMECGCCFDDEVLQEDMLPCPDGHMFCRECVRRSSEANIGESKYKFLCLTGDCESEFALSVLKSALSAKVFSNLLRKVQEEEIRQAGIPNLVSCPFCSFATIMEDENDKLFRCQNPACLRESCRLCREPSHIPLRCNEVERRGETSMRTYIENRMSEAMLRECWRCHKRFYKTEGCNKMTCTCGASMCYVCRKPIKGYDHFNSGQCENYTDVSELHRREMEKAAHEARQRYTSDNPEAATTQLRHDPLQHLVSEQRRGPWQLWNAPAGDANADAMLNPLDAYLGLDHQTIRLLFNAQGGPQPPDVNFPARAQVARRGAVRPRFQGFPFNAGANFGADVPQTLDEFMARQLHDDDFVAPGLPGVDLTDVVDTDEDADSDSDASVLDISDDDKTANDRYRMAAIPTIDIDDDGSDDDDEEEDGGDDDDGDDDDDAYDEDNDGAGGDENDVDDPHV